MPTRKFKCPVCGYRFLTDPEGIYKAGQVSVTRDARSQMQMSGASTPAASTIDLNCPNCKNDFEVAIGA